VKRKREEKKVGMKKKRWPRPGKNRRRNKNASKQM
jgi:hypothetical protein